MVCLSPVGYGVQLTFRALALRRSRLFIHICFTSSIFHVSLFADNSRLIDFEFR